MIITTACLTLGALLSYIAQKRSDAVFLSYTSKNLTISYGEFLRSVRQTAKGLIACGVKKGDHVALWAGNRLEWVICYLAVVSIGAVLVTVNTRYQSTELRYVLEQSDSCFLILERSCLKENLFERLCEVLPEIGIQRFGVVSSSAFPKLRGVILLEDSSVPGALSYKHLIERGNAVSDEELENAIKAVTPEDVALMIYTSGTTGQPKGVEQQHFALIHRMNNFAAWNNMNESDSTFFALPFFHSFGAVVAIIGALVTGSKLCILEKFQAKTALEIISRERCTVIHGVPSTFAMLLKEPGFETYDLSSGRTGVLGGAPCPPDLAKSIIERIAPNISAAWGLTEACGMVTASLPSDTASQIAFTVGKVISGSEVIIIDPLDGHILPDGEIGQILVKSSYNMRGYYRMEEATQEAIDEKGCLHTGDLGRFDEEGYLRITGRLSDMFIVGGVNTYPSEIENHIRSLHGIEDVQIVGVFDDRLGEVGCAYVIKRPGSSLTSDDITRHCMKLANYKIPRYIKFVESYPLTESGKVKKYELQKDFEVSNRS